MDLLNVLYHNRYRDGRKKCCDNRIKYNYIANSLLGRVSLGGRVVVPSVRICYNIHRNIARLTLESEDIS